MRSIYKSIPVLLLILLAGSINAQTINWNNLKKENKHVMNLNVGLHHGVIYGAGYGYTVSNRRIPVIANVEFSIPWGNELIDDYKAKIGAKIRWIKAGSFQVSTDLHGVFRSYKNDFVHLLNFGSDFSGVAGHYKPKWFAAGEFGFDKAIVTHFKHTSSYKNQYAGVADGWFELPTAGNFYYGIQTGYSFSKADVTLRAGKTIAQDFRTSPMVPYYVQLGYNIRL